MRPAGSFGEVRLALARAAEASPGTVREIAIRAQVATGVARYTASRMLDEGALVVVQPGRPAVVATPAAAAAMSRPQPARGAGCVGILDQSFWDRQPEAASA